jgi:sec-independent protein translocase protein TatA
VSVAQAGPGCLGRGMLGNIGPLEIGVVLLVALLVFGPKRLPELGNGLGRGLREFKESVSGERRDEPEDHASPGIPGATVGVDETAPTPARPGDSASPRA